MAVSVEQVLRTSVHELVRPSPEIKQAVADGQPIVALESSIITHGMSYPENVESARTCEAVIREAGAIPATIAIIDGHIRVGLSDRQLQYIGEHQAIRKASRRDLAMILAKRTDGATTVATTMLIADLAGIRVFATGGIGGVHRYAQQSFDISADLLELARTPVAVVCAGAKSILDIKLTLEVLETQGVPVIGYRTDAFPAFYLRDSGFGVDDRADDVATVAEAMRIRWNLGLSGGFVVANPIPEQFEMDQTLITQSIDAAVEKADRTGIRGQEVTPFILSELHELTGGKSLASNKQLVYHNASVAAGLAVAYQNL